MISSIGKAVIVAMMFADAALSAPLDHCSNAFDTSDIVLTTTNVRYTVTVIPMRDLALSIHSSNILKQNQPTSTSSAATANTIQPEKLAAVSAFKARVSSVQDAAESSGHNSSYFHSRPCSKHSPCTGDLTFYETAISASAPSACNTIDDGGKSFVLALPRGIMAKSDRGKTVHIKYREDRIQFHHLHTEILSRTLFRNPTIPIMVTPPLTPFLAVFRYSCK